MYSTNLITRPLAIEGNPDSLENDKSAVLRSHTLPEYNTAAEIASAMGISVGKLRFLTSSFPGSQVKHYVHFKISKKTGGERLISAPKPNLNPVLEKLLPASQTVNTCVGRVNVV
ncbi:MAG: hypothetical protein RMY28_023600 [Nostoc sp. ChiSLP01]|nr:hypothetical protein [Nostoc sp. CmiSLP01]MDZ8289429.1 hypothetical protein [Nostoc sp. ChiSLP01]